jgi:hypothetical protein
MAAFLEAYGDKDFAALLEATEPLASNASASTTDLLHDMRRQRYLQKQAEEEMEVSEEENQGEEVEEEEEEPEAEVALRAPPPRPSSSVQTAPVQDQEQAAREAGLRLYRAAEAGMRQAAASSACPVATRLFAAVETALAGEHGLSWQERGPRGEGQPLVWRNQRWRQTSGRYANRGGQRQAEFAAFFAAKGKNKSQGEQGKGKGPKGKNKVPEGKSKGKGSEGKNKAKGEGKDNSKEGKGLEAQNKGKGKVPDGKGKEILPPKPKTRPGPYPTSSPGILDLLSQFESFYVSIVFTLKWPNCFQNKNTPQ